MKTTSAKSPLTSQPDNGGPVYRLQAIGTGHGQLMLEIWQLPSPATPRLVTKEKTATLKGRALQIVETRVLRRLKAANIRVPTLNLNEAEEFPLDEETALNLAILFRTLAPMRSIERVRQVSEGIDQMSREEAGYWLGMAVHRKNPRRVLAALRMLLTM